MVVTVLSVLEVEHSVGCQQCFGKEVFEVGSYT
jgi:hypothetical protein